MKKFMSINEVCKATGLSQHFVRQMVRNNEIPFIKSGSKVLINYDLASAILDRMCGSEWID